MKTLKTVRDVGLVLLGAALVLLIIIGIEAVLSGNVQP
jgi:hypothetical protein